MKKKEEDGERKLKTANSERLRTGRKVAKKEFKEIIHNCSSYFKENKRLNGSIVDIFHTVPLD